MHAVARDVLEAGDREHLVVASLDDGFDELWHRRRRVWAEARLKGLAQQAGALGFCGLAWLVEKIGGEEQHLRAQGAGHRVPALGLVGAEAPAFPHRLHRVVVCGVRRLRCTVGGEEVGRPSAQKRRSARRRASRLFPQRGRERIVVVE